MYNEILKRLRCYYSSFHQQYLKPNSNNEDQARREYIFNILVNGFLALNIVAFAFSLVRHITQGGSAQNVPPYVLIVPIVVLLCLYTLSRRKFNNKIVYVFIGLYVLLGTYALYLYSIALPQGLLVYVLVIIMSGILISSRAALIMTIIIVINLIVLASLQINGTTKPYTAELDEPFKMQDVGVYIMIFTVIFLVSWLSSREVDASLRRARHSERELKAERNLLEVKVRQRTKELEKAQVEKTLELYRFAEFGRLSSSLLHDLANPLTAVSLTFGQLEDGRNSDAAIQIRDGITHMEQYMHSARRQLRSESETRVFDSKDTIEKVVSFLLSKARSHKVKLVRRLSDNAMLFGDSVRLSQIIANLVANGIDSYSGTDISIRRTVTLTSKIDHAIDSLVISVRDNGIGIPEDELSRIFEPFYTTKSSDRGTGIGLTITKRIVEEEFNGAITVKASDKKGITFIVILPLYRGS